MMKFCFVLIFLFAGGALGWLDKRIVGSLSCKKERPYHVEIRSVQKGKSCAGALLNTRWLITASHCAGQKVKVKLGANSASVSKKIKSFFSGSKKTLEQEIDLEQQFPRKDEEGHDHDIMLIKLKKDVSAQLHVIDMPSGECTKPASGEAVEIGGMGAKKAGKKPGHHLKCAQTKITDCTENDKPESKYFSSEETTMCAFKPGVEACFGDAGSAVEYNGRLHGIIVNEPADTCDNTIVMLNICHYKDWIEKTMKDN